MNERKTFRRFLVIVETFKGEPLSAGYVLAHYTFEAVYAADQRVRGEFHPDGVRYHLWPTA